MNEKELIIIKLQSEEDLNEKIIKEKGNTKCIFYSDDVCRKGDKTRDCVNCARVEYHSLYSLNWNNQERLQEELKRKEEECKELRDELEWVHGIKDQLKAENDECIKDNEYLKTIIKDFTQEVVKLKQALQEIQEIAYELTNEEYTDFIEHKQKQILQKCEVLDD